MRQERFIDGPQGKLWTSSWGDPHTSLPILLVHADLGTSHQWNELREGLDERHTTIAFDRRGHGRSDIPRDGVFTFEAGAADILAVADFLNIRRFVLIGHSGGALTAWNFAALHGDRVAGFLLVDPPPDPSRLPREQIEQTLDQMRGPDYQRVAQNYYRSIAGTNEAVVERVVAEAGATAQVTLVGCFEALRDFDPHQLAGRYSGPTLSVIQPQFDVEGALHRIPPGWEHTAIPGTGHWIQLDAAGPFLDCVKNFLAKRVTALNRL